MMNMQQMQSKMPGKPPGGAQQQQQQMSKPQDAPAAATQMVPREGAPLSLSAGMDPALVTSKIVEIAKAIIGEGEDMEEIEVDTPLMQAGITSNTAVILRDQLSQELPGVKLPPTLMFDYPSVAAITDFII